MRYVLLKDLKGPLTVDDGFAGVPTRPTKDDAVQQITYDSFTEIDIMEILKNAPESADSIVDHKGWKYWNTKTGKVLGPVFNDTQ